MKKQTASKRNEKALASFRKRMQKVNHAQKMSVLADAQVNAQMRQTEVIDIMIAQKKSHAEIAEMLCKFNAHYDLKKAYARIERHLKHDFDRRIAKRCNDVSVKSE